jgi:Ca2+-binding RTX toxin-like protein
MATTDAATLLGRSADKTVVLSGVFTDVGTLGTHTALVNWGDGSAPVLVTVNATNRTFSETHTYLTGGIFAITVTVTDDDGGTSVSTTSAVVEGVGLVNGTLYIIGTDGRDKVELKQDAKNGTLKVDVKLNDGGCVGGSDAIPQMVFGGNGDDKISGGQSNDALFGGAGNDDIKGGRGADILVDGDGKDNIKGGRGNDLLIGGSLVNDCNDLSIIGDIDAAMAEWATGDLADSFSYLGTIVDGDDKDDLFGEKDNDTIYGGKGDKVKG